jgi:hypothetical protein
MTQKKQEWPSALVKVRRDLITRGPSLLARRALDDLARLMAQPPSGPERIPFHVLYADWGIGNILHDLVLRALGAKRHIFPIWASHEQEIRFLWTQKHYHCAFLVLNNIIVPHSRNPEERIKSVLALIPWLRERSSATIIALNGWPQSGIEEEALHGGADRFFSLPFPPTEVLDLLRKRFGEPAGP